MSTRETDPFIRTTPVVKDQGYNAVVPPPFVTVQYSIEDWKRGKPGTVVSDPHSVLQTINMESTGFSLDVREGFNRFLTRGIVSIMTARPIRESPNTIIVPTGNVRVIKPTRPISDTKSVELTPNYCLANKLTYESSVQVEMCRQNLRTRGREILGYVTVGPLPIMTGSIACVLTDSEGVLKPQKIISERYGECFSDPYGYFIINGTHYVLVMQDKLRVNTPFIILLSKKSNVDPEAGPNPYPGLICTSATPLGTTVLRIYRSRLGKEFKVSLSQLSVIDFDPNVRNVNIATVLFWMRKYILSLERRTASSEDIYAQVYEDVGKRILSSLPESHYGKAETYLNVSFAVPNNESAQAYRRRIEAFARYFRISDPSEMTVIREYISLVLPHIDYDYSYLRPADIVKLKYDTLISFLTRFMEFLVGIIPLDDRDDYGNKMLETAGSRMERKFLEIWAGMGRNFKRGRPVTTVASAVEAAIESGGSKSIIDTINQKLKARMIDYMELFNGGRTYVPGTSSSSGFAKPLIWDSMLSPHVYIREIAAKVNEQNKNAALRSVAPSQLGYVCFVTTREGKGCGKIKALSLGARLSTYGNPREIREALADITTNTATEGSIEVYIDHIPQGLYLIDSTNPWLQVAKLRRQGLIAWDTGIVYNARTRVLNLLISPNRLVRPLLTVTDAEIGKRKLLMDVTTFDIIDAEGKVTDTISAWDMLYEQKLSEGNLGFQTLLSEGIVEYIDAAEQAQIQVAQHIWDMEERQASYLELKRKIEVSGSEAAHTPEPQPEGLLIRGGPEYKKIQEEKKSIQLRLRSGGQRLAPDERRRLLSRQKELDQEFERLFYGPLWERLSKERKDIEEKRAQLQVQRIAAEAQVPPEERNIYNPIWLEYLDRLEAVNAAHDAWREEYRNAIDRAQVVDPNARRTVRITPIDVTTTLEAQLQRARAYADITHCELDPASVLSIQAALIPFIGHNQAPRNTFQCKMSNQSVGIIHSRYLNRFALELRVLAYPQRALVETNAHQLLGMDALPIGNSVRLAICTAKGWNQEDALVIAKDYIDRGGLCYLQYSTYTHVLTQSGATRDEFKAPEAARSSDMSRDIYHGLGPNGIARRGAYLREGDVWLNVRRTLPRDENGELKYHDINFTVKPGKDGVVDYVHLYKSRGGADAVMVRLAHYRTPQEGDKYHIRPAQKATLARIVPREDMPFTTLTRRVGGRIVTETLSPDVIMNPHAIPSRMTIGTIIEMLLGWPAVEMGIRFNAAATRPWNLNEFVRKLAQLPGFSNLGLFYMRDGETGETMRSAVHVGYSYIGELKHYVKDKIQSRSVGKVDALKRQPLSGRGRTQGAAVKLGEMERDTLIGHGASELTYERFCVESDRFLVTVCRTCRSMLGIRYTIGTHSQGFSCRACGEKAELVNVNIPYTFRHIIFETTALGLAQRLILQKASAEV